MLPGQEHDVEERNARILIANGKVEAVLTTPPPTPAEDTKAEATAAPESATTTTAGRKGKK